MRKDGMKGLLMWQISFWMLTCYGKVSVLLLNYWLIGILNPNLFSFCQIKPVTALICTDWQQISLMQIKYWSQLHPLSIIWHQSNASTFWQRSVGLNTIRNERIKHLQSNISVKPQQAIVALCARYFLKSHLYRNDVMFFSRHRKQNRMLSEAAVCFQCRGVFFSIVAPQCILNMIYFEIRMWIIVRNIYFCINS